jgi:hypothetical protein
MATTTTFSIGDKIKYTNDFGKSLIGIIWKIENGYLHCNAIGSKKMFSVPASNSVKI